jgi:hypothetical protein
VPVYVDREVVKEVQVEVVKESPIIRGYTTPNSSNYIKYVNNIDGTQDILLSGDFEVTKVAPTGSMRPVMDSGTTVLLSTNPVKLWDFAVYEKADGGLILHQIIGEDGDYWIFQGTNNGYADSPVLKSRVVYRVEAVIY